MLYPHPQIYHHLRAIFIHVPKAAGTSIERSLRLRPGDVVGGHTTVSAYRSAFPKEYREYFKFGVVRAPATRLHSAFRYLRREPIHRAHGNQFVHEGDTLSAFLETLLREPALVHRLVHLIPQHRFVCDASGQVAVDFLCRYESLASDWETVCQRLGLPASPLPVLNRTTPAPLSATERELLIECVRHFYAQDCALFGYEPETGLGTPNITGIG